MSKLSLSPVLVTGGNGFIAYHIIAKVLAEDPDCEVHSIDINISRNRHSGVTYHEVDLADGDAVNAAIAAARPATIFHTASPEFSNVPVSEYHRIIAGGTTNLLAAARDTGALRVLVYTSTSSVVHDNLTDLVDAREDLPILRPPAQQRVYSLAKADAEEAIIAANRAGGDGDVLTASLRPCLAFGERDVGALGKMVAVALQGRSRFQMGNGQNPYDFVCVENLADAHLLTAQALHAAHGKPQPPPDRRVDGQCFNITNDDPWLFWDFQRAVSAAAGKPVRTEDIVVIPKWAGMLMGFVSEWVVWALSAGKNEPNMTREGIRFSTMIRTLNVEKAKSVLGYRPKVSMQDGIERGVSWFIEGQRGVEDS